MLGAVLVDNAAFNSAAEVLTRNDFYRESHRRIFEAMAALAERSQPIDLVTLKDELIKASALEGVGGAAYLASLLDGVPRITNVEHWSRIIKEKAVLRNLIHASTRIVQECYEAEDDPALLLDRAEKAIFDIAEHRIRQGFVGIREIVKESFRTIDQLSQSKELVTGIPTGFVDLDEKTSGLQKGDLIIVAARPAMGKTSFCLNIAQYASIKTGETVGIFSLEMAKEQLVAPHVVLRRARGLAPAAHGKPPGEGLGAPGQGLRGPVLVQDLHRRFRDPHPAGDAREVPPAEGGARPQPGGGRLPPAHVGGGAGGEPPAGDRVHQPLAEGAGQGAVGAGRRPQPALPRARGAHGEAPAAQRPSRESGGLEQDADIVMFIFREEEYKASDENRGIAEIIIGKQRNGPTGTVRLAFIKEFTRFENLEWRGGA